MKIRFEIPGPPRTKKNHGRVIQRGKRKFHVQSEAHEQWNQAAQLWLAKFRAQSPNLFPIQGPVKVFAIFYRDANTGDLNGYMQALGDALQEGRIIENDKNIISWDGSRTDRDFERPRIDVTVETA